MGSGKVLLFLAAWVCGLFWGIVFMEKVDYIGCDESYCLESFDLYSIPFMNLLWITQIDYPGEKNKIGGGVI